MSFLFLPLRVGRRARGLRGPNCPWEIRVYICATATPLCALSISPGRMLAAGWAPISSCLPAHICLASFHVCQLCVQESLSALKIFALFSHAACILRNSYWYRFLRAKFLSPSFQVLYRCNCCRQPGMSAKKKKNHLLVIEIYFIHTSVIPEFLCTPSLWATKMSTIARHRELWSSRIQCPLPFPGFPSWNLFLTLPSLTHARQKGAGHKFYFTLLQGTVWHARVLIWDSCHWDREMRSETSDELVFLASSEQYMAALRNRVQKSRYCAIWISEIKVKTSYFLTAYFHSGCPIITTTSVTGSGSSCVISTLWKPVMPFSFIYFLI